MAHDKKKKKKKKHKKLGYGGLGDVSIVQTHDADPILLIDGEDAGGNPVNLWVDTTLIDPAPFVAGAVIEGAQAFIFMFYISLEQFKIYSLLSDWDNISPP